MGDYRPSHVGLCVRDLDRSLRFFCDGLGFDKAEGFELDSDVGRRARAQPRGARAGEDRVAVHPERHDEDRAAALRRSPASAARRRRRATRSASPTCRSTSTTSTPPPAPRRLRRDRHRGDARQPGHRPPVPRRPRRRAGRAHGPPRIVDRLTMPDVELTDDDERFRRDVADVARRPRRRGVRGAARAAAVPATRTSASTCGSRGSTSSARPGSSGSAGRWSPAGAARRSTQQMIWAEEYARARGAGARQPHGREPARARR